MTEEENNPQNPGPVAPDLGKFKSVDALAQAYRELEAEFTRRSHRLKALEEAARSGETAPGTVPDAAEKPAQDRVFEDGEALYAAASQNEAVRKRIVGDYLASLNAVPLMAGGGAPVRAPARRISTIGEAGAFALGYLKNQT